MNARTRTRRSLKITRPYETWSEHFRLVDLVRSATAEPTGEHPVEHAKMHERLAAELATERVMEADPRSDDVTIHAGSATLHMSDGLISLDNGGGARIILAGGLIAVFSGNVMDATGGMRAPIFTTPQFTKVDDGHLLSHDDDLYAFQKPLTDVLLIGSAHSVRGPVTELDTCVSVGPVTKRVRVIGNRSLRVRADGSLSATAPQRFESMPIAWTRAYGGRDEGAERILVPDRENVLRQRRIPTNDDRLAMGTYAYPRNRFGRGFHIDVERTRLDGAPLPNLSDPDDPFSVDRMLAQDPNDWIDRPLAAGYAPIDGATYPRCVHCGIVPISPPPMRALRELALGGLLVKDLERSLSEPRDPRAYNSAPPGMAVARLSGAERVHLWNLHRRHECGGRG